MKQCGIFIDTNLASEHVGNVERKRKERKDGFVLGKGGIRTGKSWWVTERSGEK